MYFFFQQKSTTNHVIFINNPIENMYYVQRVKAAITNVKELLAPLRASREASNKLNMRTAQ